MSDRLENQLDYAYNRLQAAHERIEKLEAALDDMGQYISRADWFYLKPETLAALGGKKDV